MNCKKSWLIVAIPCKPGSIYDTLAGTEPGEPRRHPSVITSFIDTGMGYGSDDALSQITQTLP